MKTKPDVLIPDEVLEQGSDFSPSIPGWARLGLIAGGAVLALGRLDGFALAAGHDASAVDQIGLDHGGGQDAAL